MDGKQPSRAPGGYGSLAVTVDVVAFMLQERKLHILLIRRGHPPYRGEWAIPGGFVEVDESLEAAAQRELAEETGITVSYLEQLRAYGDPGRDPRMRIISVAFLALLSAGVDPHAADDAAQVAWFPCDDLPPLAFDHADIIEYALQSLRFGVANTRIGYHLLPDEFTLSELQAVYEIVLNKTLDKRNFRRRILAANILEKTGRTRMGEGRPAVLYRRRPEAFLEAGGRRLFP